MHTPFRPPLPGNLFDTQNQLQFPSFACGGPISSPKNTPRRAKRHENPVEFAPPPGPQKGKTARNEEDPGSMMEEDSPSDLDQNYAKNTLETPKNTMDSPLPLGPKGGIFPLAQGGISGSFGDKNSSLMVQNPRICAPNTDPKLGSSPFSYQNPSTLANLVEVSQNIDLGVQNRPIGDQNPSLSTIKNEDEKGSPMMIDGSPERPSVASGNEGFEGALVPRNPACPAPFSGTEPASSRSYGTPKLLPIGSLLGGSLSPLPQMPNFECLAHFSVRRGQDGSGRGFPRGTAPDPHGSVLNDGKQRLLAGISTVPEDHRLMAPIQNVQPNKPSGNILVDGRVLMEILPGNGESPVPSGEKRQMTPTSHDSSVGGKWQKLMTYPPSPVERWRPWGNRQGPPVRWCQPVIN